MSNRWARLGTLLTVCTVACAPTEHGVEFRNGRWYDGSAFREGTWYSVGGRLTAERPDSVTDVVDLEGRHVIPPFGEAHNHRPDGWPGTERHVAQFMEHGIFYVMNPNSFPGMVAGIGDGINTAVTTDVIFAHGGLTPPGSHVTELYERNFDRGIFPDDWTRERLDGEGMNVVRNLEDLDRVWPALLADGPDFIKVFMGFSAEYERRRDDSAYVGRRGIDPALVPLIVERAHDAGLRVAAHIETAEDFRRAVAAGVDVIAHMPASWRVGERAGADTTIDRWLLRDGDAAEAARGDVAVVAHVAYGFSRADVARIHEHNLALLKRHGVRLAIGSDSYRTTALREAVYLQSTDLFIPAEVLRIASETTARVIFPDRQIGRLAEGYEASFLAIEGDPVADPLFALRDDDLAATIAGIAQRIRLRVKQGQVLGERQDAAGATRPNRP